MPKVSVRGRKTLGRAPNGMYVVGALLLLFQCVLWARVAYEVFTQ